MSFEETRSKGVENEKPAQNAEASDTRPAMDPEKQDHGRQERQNDKNKKDEPAGGFDATPIPQRPAGYTVRITIHRAENLPMADYHSLSSDPYVMAQLNCETPMRHKEDPYMRWRTPTIRESTEPEWNESWTIANVPASGFKLKLRVYDEDPADGDDRLGNVHVHVGSIGENWEGIDKRPFQIKARSGSRRAYLFRAIAACFSSNKHLRGTLYLSIECLGRTPEDGQNGRLYTVGPCRWFKHFSPMLGRIAHTKDDSDDEEAHEQHGLSFTNTQNGRKSSRQVQRYNFQANEIQLRGPVPTQLYHRYVEFKPWVKRMFTSSGIQGVLISKVLHHQHSRVYNFDRRTQWGYFPDAPSQDLTRQFLDLVHHDKGGRIFTYVLTLDALWRFTETGKEFGIDMLSKHTMHSDVSVYIAFSGEFFIRRLKHPHRPHPPEPVDETSQDHPGTQTENETHPPHDIVHGPPDEEPIYDPTHYELVIDNDSGTYRPNADLLPILKDFLSRSLPGLHIQTLDCQADADKMAQMKQEQRELKKREGDHIVYTQGSTRASSISSSDEESLDRIQAAAGESIGGGGGGGDPNQHDGRDPPNPYVQAAKDSKAKQAARVSKAKRTYAGKARPGADREMVRQEAATSA
ncbi:hypothetical protein D0863_12707 [Hortaea werneckii]|uniref:C2 domain-containing protein n=1 Tax=Hortaea werneckii TaxID=91943 RepID=A0A3M7CYM9_HORWE|nr:hypothetical protein D0863_12707 [Hortaea werneckii]